MEIKGKGESANKFENTLLNEGDYSQALTVLRIQEEERRRVAMDLHDVSLQNLAHLVHKLELCSFSMDIDLAKAKLDLAEIGDSLRSVIDEVRSIIFDLRPIDFGESGMREDLLRLLYKMNEQNRFFISTDIDDLTFHNHITQVSIYRIVKECINNALRHSKGNQIDFSLKQKESVCEIMIKDNGIGFETDNIQDKRHNHFGLSMIEERVSLLHGTWKIESNDQTGTTITITLPWSE